MSAKTAMPGQESRLKRGLGTHTLPLLILLSLNAIVFSQHYFSDCGFTWDFVQAYFGKTSLSIRALEAGILPQWLPFQCMGYPYPLDLQSGLFYPAFWIFPLLNLTFDLRAATIVQCLHVLLGAVGAYFLLYRLSASRWAALVGATMFHFFGGFYSNAQHPDIVRSFSLLPWILLAATASSQNSGFKLELRNVLLPGFVYLAATGGYPGNLIAITFIAVLYIFFQAIDQIVKQRPHRETLLFGLTLVALLLLGIGLASIHLGPAWAYKSELLRWSDELSYRALWIEHLPLLFYSSTPLAGEPSMTSTFLSVPGLLLVFFVSWRRLRTSWPWLGILLVSALMVAGPRSLFWEAAVYVFQPLGFSRFPSSDYRPIIALSLVVLGIEGLLSLARRELSPRSFSFRAVLGLSIVVLTGAMLYGGPLRPEVLIGLGFAGASIILYLAMRSLPVPRQTASTREPDAVLAALLATLISLNSLYTLNDMPTWREPNISTLYERRGWADLDSVLRDDSMFLPQPGQRPPRELPGHKHWYSWAGYLEPRYMLADKTPCLLASAESVLGDPQLEPYMMSSWTPLLFPEAGVPSSTSSVTVGRDELGEAIEKAERQTDNQVRQTAYGIQEVAYSVSLVSETLLVENELYFPGWKGRILSEGRATELTPIEVNGVLRGWNLPPGQYDLITKFRLPHFNTFLAASFAALAAWILALLSWSWITWRNRRLSIAKV